MARRADLETLITCPECGEEYSATYKRCPFCGEKRDKFFTGAVPPISDDGYEDNYVFDGGDVFDDVQKEPAEARVRGGKRLNEEKRRETPGPINWPRLITFICALIIIAAALVIVFSYIYPRIHTDPGPGQSQSQPGSQDPGSSQSPGGSDQPGQPTDDPGQTDDPVEPTDDPGQTESQPPVDNPASSIKLKPDDFTLKADESWTIKATVSPSGWEGEITWTSSNTKVAKVSKDGTVTNVNTSSSTQSVTITATAGGVTATAKVYCRGGSSGSSSSGDGDTSGSGDLTLNKSDFTLVLGASEPYRLRATGSDSVTWSSSDESVATVDEHGLVTAVGKGKATITATASDGSKATCIVRVRE